MLTKTRLSFSIFLALGLTTGTALAETVVHVAYPFPETWKPIHTVLAKAFEAKHPDIKIEFMAPFANYDEATQKILRGSITGDLPDLAWLGLNRQRIFVDKNVAVDLSPFIAQESDWEKRGYSGALMDLGSFKGKAYGLATGVSLPVVYYNPDIVAKVGGNPDAFPNDWDAILALASKVKDLNDGTETIVFPWDSTGNWLFQNLVLSAGGAMLTADEKKVAFSDKPGQWAVTTLSRMVTEGGMKNVDEDSAIQSFVAGKLAMYAGSIADLTGIEKSVGDRFHVRVANFPLPDPNGKLAGGGAAGMMFTKDPETQKAAWEYLKFAASAEGSALVVQNSGYLPPNQLAIGELTAFYKEHPNNLLPTERLPHLTKWYAFLGANGLKISDVIKDNLGQVVSGTAQPADALAKMAQQVTNLLPAGE